MPLVHYFVETCKINLDAQDQNGYTALMIASTSHQTSELVQYLIKQGGQLFMQDLGDEVTNNIPGKVPRFSSYIRPLVAGLLKMFVFSVENEQQASSSSSSPPRFVYRYMVISVEGFLLYFDQSSVQDATMQRQKLPLFHSANIQGKINLKDVAFNVSDIHDSVAHLKNKSNQVDYPIVFEIPALSFQWILFAEDADQQELWCNALLYLCRDDLELDHQPSRMHKLPAQVNSNPSFKPAYSPISFSC